MRRERIWLFLLAIMMIGGFFYGIVRLFQFRYEVGDIYPPYSSLRADPLGTKALYKGIDSLPDCSCFRNYQPFTKRKDLTQITIFYLGLDPTGFLYGTDKESVEAAEEMIANGGRLVLSFFPVSKLNTFEKFGQNDTEDGQQSEYSHDESQQQKQEENRRSKNVEGDEREESEGKEPLEDEAIPLKLDERWGVKLDTAASSNDDENVDGVSLTAQLAIQHATSLPISLSWHTALYFIPQNNDWRVIYRRDNHPVLIERPYGKGSIMLSADSYFFSNEAMRTERHPELLAWIIGKHSQVMFDETHFGIMQSPGIVSLIRKYRLGGVVAGLFVLAGLFVWKNATSFVPRQDERTPGQSVEGKDMMSGLVNLLRSNISSKEIVPSCVTEWKKTFAHRQKNDPKTFEHIDTLLMEEKSRSFREQDPLRLYHAIRQILTEKSKRLGGDKP